MEIGPFDFRFPADISFTVTEERPGKVVAHALDLDIVVVRKTRARAVKVLRETIRFYVKFGIDQGWGHHLVHKAPDEFWPADDLLKKMRIDGPNPVTVSVLK